jgi:hypothetical protein
MKKEETGKAKESEQRMLQPWLPVAIHKSLRIRAAERDAVQRLVVEIIACGLRKEEGES